MFCADRVGCGRRYAGRRRDSFLKKNEEERIEGFFMGLDGGRSAHSLAHNLGTEEGRVR